MSILSGKKVLLGISGGIAAYKTPSLVRCQDEVNNHATQNGAVPADDEEVTISSTPFLK